MAQPQIIEIYLPPGREKERLFWQNRNGFVYYVYISCPSCGHWHRLQRFCSRACASQFMNLGKRAVHPEPIMVVRSGEPFDRVTVPQNMFIEDIKKEQVLKVWEETKFNKSKTARILGITRRTLYNYLENWGIHKPKKEVKNGP